jgi:hypothetical protein
MKSKAARSFMILFNAWYYSFSPQISASITTHPTERAIVRDGMYPLVAVLYTSYYVYVLVVSFLGVEEATVLAGIVAASLLGLVYLAPIAFLVKRVIPRHAKSSPRVKDTILWVTISILAFGVAYPLSSQVLGIAAANLVLSMLTLASLFGSAMLTSAANMVAKRASRWPLILGGCTHRLTFGLTPPGLKSKH